MDFLLFILLVKVVDRVILYLAAELGKQMMVCKIAHTIFDSVEGEPKCNIIEAKLNLLRSYKRLNVTCNFFLK